MNPLCRLLLAALAAATVAACGTIPSRDTDRQDTTPGGEPSSGVELIPLEPDQPAPQPRTAELPENLLAAAEVELREALAATPPRRQSAYLDAAHTLIRAGRLDAASKVLSATEVGGLSRALAARKRLLRGEIHWQRGNLDQAGRDAGAVLKQGNIAPAYLARALDIKARVALRQGRALAAAATWVQRDSYLTDTDALRRNHQRIWYALGRLEPIDLQLAGQEMAQPGLRGWLDLAILYLESGTDRYARRQAVDRWRDANPGHPAASFSAVLLGPRRAPQLARVALLLPLSSDFGGAAQRVYNGFDAAHGTDTHPQRPRILFQDVGAEPALVGNYVGAAEANGADVIVGPLGKDAVNALLASRQPQTPMLMLGTASDGQPAAPGSYQFDLSPEPEARRMAVFMYLAGHRRVAALYPRDDWGQRVYQAFAAHWRQLGGSLAGAQAYPPDGNDFSGPIKALFNLEESETRQTLLASRLGLNLHFDARRRADIDALVMVARPAAARLLKPQIDFFRGHDLPVYSTSAVYPGASDPARDADLDGIRFPHMPWTLRDTVRVNRLQASLRDAGYSNVDTELFAFGFDAYRLALLAADPELAAGTRISGLTADLIFGADGQLQRRFDWAQFERGQPVRIWPD